MTERNDLIMRFHRSFMTDLQQMSDADQASIMIHRALFQVQDALIDLPDDSFLEDESIPKPLRYAAYNTIMSDFMDKMFAASRMIQNLSD